MTTRTQTRPVLVLLPRLTDGRIILVRRETRWALPACPMPSESELPAVVADLLHKTTDYAPGRLTLLGEFRASGTNHCFLVDDLCPSSFPPAHAGQTMTTSVHLYELKQMIRLGIIQCDALIGSVRLLDAAGALDGAATVKQQFVK